MPFYFDANVPLPKFRYDLRLYKGPNDLDGSPTFSLFDPVKGQYYKINWRQSLILQSLHPGMTINELCLELNARTVAKITPEDIKDFFEDALRYNLLETKKHHTQLLKESTRLKVGVLQKLFYKYLYFRLPILKPDRFLKKTLPYVKFLISPLALAIYFIFTLSGLFMLVNRFEEYVNTFTHFFNFNGFIIYILGIGFFKLIHEFAHAYTATYYKVHIPSMGVAFILLFPVLYTDTTDGWKLSSRSARLKISAAGLISELILAGLCTFGWAVSPPGALKSMFFVVSSVLWLSSVLVNLNPAMRYDGYYLLCDWLGIDNLQSRAFTYTKWCIYRYFFGMKLPCPEEDISKRLRIFLVSYSIFTWVYRLFFYTGIALFTYMMGHQAKLFAILLFLFTMYTLIIKPLSTELVDFIKLKSKTRMNLNTIVSSFFLMIIGFIFLSPLPKNLKLASIVVPTQTQNIYVPENTQVEKIYVERGATIEKGAPLITFDSTPLDTDVLVLQLKEKIAEREITLYQLDKKYQPLVKEKTQELVTIKTQLNKFNELEKMLNVTSEISGDLIFWDQNLKVGQYVPKGMHVGSIASPTKKVIAFVPEKELSNLIENQKAKYLSKRSMVEYDGYISYIEPLRSEYLEYPALGEGNGGTIATTETQIQGSAKKKLKIDGSMYLVEVTLNNPNAKLVFGEVGTIKVSTNWESYLSQASNFIKRVFWRESAI